MQPVSEEFLEEVKLLKMVEKAARELEMEDRKACGDRYDEAMFRLCRVLSELSQFRKYRR